MQSCSSSLPRVGLTYTLLLQSLRLHLDYSGIGRRKRGAASADFEYAGRDAWASAYSTVAAGAALVAGLGVMAYLKRAG
jgi:hypothetical protein